MIRAEANMDKEGFIKENAEFFASMAKSEIE